MWTKALKAKKNPKSLALQDFGGTVSQLREISTNSAIHRGIRESILYPSFARRPRLANLPSLHSSKPEDVSGNTYARRLKIPKRQRSVLKKIEKIDKSLRREDSRPRRPNHAGRQDAEDIEESTLQVRKRLSEKLAGYKRDSRAAAAIKKHFIFSENYRGKRHWDGGTDPIILNAIVNDPTGTRRYDDGRDNRKTQEGRYRGDSELNVQDLVQQVRSRSKEPEAGRRAQAPPVSSHEGREDSARGSASWKNAYSKDHESGGGYPPASKNFDRDKRSEGRLSKSQRGQGVFAGEESFRGNAYGRSDESQGELFPTLKVTVPLRKGVLKTAKLHRAMKGTCGANALLKLLHPHNALLEKRQLLFLFHIRRQHPNFSTVRRWSWLRSKLEVEPSTSFTYTRERIEWTWARMRM